MIIFFACLFVLICILYFLGKHRLTTLRPFINLKDVADNELEILDIKRAESEGVSEKENYPHYYRGGKTGFLLIHGFTGAPYELIPLAEFLNNEGHSVYLSRVAGHGSNPANLNKLTYEDWYESVKYGYFLLKNNCEKIIVVGQSMGGLIAINTSINNSADGLILLAPCIRISNPLSALVPYVKYLKKFDKKKVESSEKKYFYEKYPMEGVHQLMIFTDYSRPLAEKVNTPVLMFQHYGDRVVKAEASEDFFERIASDYKTAVYFDKDESGYHTLCGSNNPHREKMFAGIREWVNVI